LGFETSLELLAPPTFLSEALYVLGADLANRIELTPDLLKTAKMFTTACVLSERETELYVELAALIDDGEAQALAVAIERKVPLLSDDGAGIAAATSRGATVLTTLDLAVQWAQGRSEAEIRDACVRLRNRARYAVPREHQHSTWYKGHLS